MINKNRLIFARYLWLYDEIASKGPITFQTINEHWMRAKMNIDGDPLPHKTFENHRHAIEDLFDISIECNRANNTYYIEENVEPDFSKAAIDMLNSALLLNRVQFDPEMRNHIRPELSNEDSSLLFTITDALSENRDLLIRYRHNYDPKRETGYRIKPIAMKQFHRRWYLIAELADESTYSFALDRIVRLDIGDKTKPSNIDVDKLFADVYGIIREPETAIEDVVLKVDREQANYFISRPLHSSQKILAQDAKTVTFGLHLSPTYDFIMEILSHGTKVKVIAPQSLHDLVARKINEMSNLYKN